MIIVRIFCGLGNELFQYALYRKLQIIGKKVSCDIQSLASLKKAGFPTLDIFPDVKIEVASKKECGYLGDNSKHIMARVRRKLWHKRTHVYECAKEKYFQKEIFGMDQVYLEGFWQSELYFEDIRDQLLKELCFPTILDKRNQELVLKMEHEISVGVHIRRGDYLKEKNQEIYGEVCTDAYYNKAISYFQRKYSNPHFYFFSNDPVWIREKYQGINMTVVDWNQGLNSYWDMYLMSRCHHNIIANSSFSWWGAWLNQHEDKEVAAPRFWFNPKCNIKENIICESWIKIGNE